MPIYAYRCTTCGHAKDVLQKMSDPLLSVCPACGASTFAKQVTAAGFQLKGSGWYVTDFRGDKSAKPADGSKDGAKDGATTDAPAKADGAKTESAAPPASAKSDAAPAPAPAAAPAPTAPPPSSK